jgi:hypothetical protein
MLSIRQFLCGRLKRHFFDGFVCSTRGRSPSAVTTGRPVRWPAYWPRLTGAFKASHPTERAPGDVDEASLLLLRLPNPRSNKQEVPVMAKKRQPRPVNRLAVCLVAFALISTYAYAVLTSKRTLVASSRPSRSPCHGREPGRPA